MHAQTGHVHFTYTSFKQLVFFLFALLTFLRHRQLTTSDYRTIDTYLLLIWDLFDASCRRLTTMAYRPSPTGVWKHRRWGGRAGF
jgi:hypothetical protein